MADLRSLLAQNKSGKGVGIPSYCTSNQMVLRALMIHALDTDYPILIEATANQVNQFGGYTGMQPADFRDLIYKMADDLGLARDRIILGGDHLGPLTWAHLPEEEAMANAATLVRLFVLAGYTKIHLDTSMKLADDSPMERLSDQVIARRGAKLYQEAMAAYHELLQTEPEAVRPSFIIGSEVPIPGGEQEEEVSLQVTKPEAVHRTIEAYQQAFVSLTPLDDSADGSSDGRVDPFADVIAIVVQPGVEFGSDSLHIYERGAALALTKAVREIPQIVMEGHSTDYQPAAKLHEMVEDGVGILKVGPALTFALREALFSLSEIERRLLPSSQWSDFPAALEAAMLNSPKNWQHHYRGSDAELQLERRYSLSDRARYYIGEPAVAAAAQRLMDNLSAVKIPLGLAHQYFPHDTETLLALAKAATAENLLQQHIHDVALTYEAAAFADGVEVGARLG